MKRILIGISLATFWFSATACNEPPKSVDVLKLFAIGDFVPHVPTVAEVKTELGAVQTIRTGHDRVYTYRVAADGWLTFLPSEALQDKYAGIEEIIYSRFPFTPEGSGQLVGKRLLGDKLMEIGLGDSVSKLDSLGVTFRKKDVELFGRKMVVYECTPQAGQDDLFYRFFIANNRVEAFSMGVTE